MNPVDLGEDEGISEFLAILGCVFVCAWMLYELCFHHR
jgi:hypothetical protein